MLDTPPSRNALDFLDAPERLTGFFQGRAIKVFLRPAGFGGRILGKGTGVAFGILRRVTGVDLLNDLSVFFRALGGMIDGFVARADRVGALLADPRHDVPDRHVAAPRPGRGGDLLPPQAARGRDAVRRPGRQPRARGAGARRRAAGELVEELGETLAGRVATSARELAALAARDERNIAHLRERLATRRC